MRSALIGTYTISIGPGNVTSTTLCDAFDLSQCQSVTGVLELTTCATDLADKLDVRFQETGDPNQIYWDTRGYWSQVSGNQSASALAPYADEFTISQGVPLASSSRDARPTGSAGATELTAGTVRDGPFQGRLRGINGVVATHRIIAVISGDANANASFIGVVRIYANTDI
jgi:hypothetical protein